jgi:mono/diheme cytochrome c family protein
MLGLYFASAILSAQTKATAAESKAAAGDAVYQARCVLCHGSDGHSQTTLGKQLAALDLHSPPCRRRPTRR